MLLISRSGASNILPVSSTLVCMKPDYVLALIDSQRQGDNGICILFASELVPLTSSEHVDTRSMLSGRICLSLRKVHHRKTWHQVLAGRSIQNQYRGQPCMKPERKLGHHSVCYHGDSNAHHVHGSMTRPKRNFSFKERDYKLEKIVHVHVIHFIYWHLHIFQFCTPCTPHKETKKNNGECFFIIVHTVFRFAYTCTTWYMFSS